MLVANLCPPISPPRPVAPQTAAAWVFEYNTIEYFKFNNWKIEYDMAAYSNFNYWNLSMASSYTQFSIIELLKFEYEAGMTQTEMSLQVHASRH